MITGLHGGNARINEESAPPSKKINSLGSENSQEQVISSPVRLLQGMCCCLFPTLRTQSNGDSRN